MNSSTSSSKFRVFGKGFLWLGFAPGLLLFLLGLWLEPVDGDLTRIGGFSERDYGWRIPQAVYRHPLPVDDQTYRYHDLLVLGDSFATARPKLQWQNRIALLTGWSIGTLSSYRMSIEQLLVDPEFKKHPPRLLIFESVERDLAARLPALEKDEGPGIKARNWRMPPRKAQTSAMDGAMVLESRSHPFSEIQIPFVARYLMRTFQRDVLGMQPGKSLRLSLRRNDLFSSRKSADLLMFRDDFKKEAGWQALGVEGLADRIRQLKARVESNGVTRLIVLVAPDKSTAYRTFLLNPSESPKSNLSALIARCSDIMPDTDRLLLQTIEKGEKDIYAPNDTHWGSSGHALIAELVLRFLGDLEGRN